MSAVFKPLAQVEPWELVADGYAAEAFAVMEPFSLRALELTPLPPEARIIDVATGPGTLALNAAPRVAEVQAVDFSGAMIEQLRARAERRGIRNVSAVVGDGQALPFPDDQFHAGYSMFGLMFFPDRPRGYSELFRVLAPGGHVVVSSWQPLQDAPLFSLVFNALRAADPSAPPPSYDPTSLENPEVLAAELRAAGFVDVVVHPHRLDFPDVAPKDMWARIVRSCAPLALLRQRLSDRDWQARMEISEAHFLREFGKREGQLYNAAWLGVGAKPA